MQLAPGCLHASAVRMAAKGVLILGASGSGKSTLALRLMALGADLIADDRVELFLGRRGLQLARPAGAPALIEVRGVGLLNAHCVQTAPLSLVVTLDAREEDRLPPLRHAKCEGERVPLFHNVTNGTFPLAIQQYLLHGRHDPDA